MKNLYDLDQERDKGPEHRMEKTDSSGGRWTTGRRPKDPTDEILGETVEESWLKGKKKVIDQQSRWTWPEAGGPGHR